MFISKKMLGFFLHQMTFPIILIYIYIPVTIINMYKYTINDTRHFVVEVNCIALSQELI